MQTVLEESLINLDSLPEAYIRLDSTFRCTFVNQAAQLLLNQVAGGLLGKTLWEVYPENVAKPIEERFRHTMAERAISGFDLHDQSRGRRYSITAMPETDEGILVRLLDTTAQENLLPWAQESTSESQLHGIARNLPGFVYQTFVRANGD